MQKSIKSNMPFWNIWLLWMLFAVLLVIGFVFFEEDLNSFHALDWLSLLLGLAPIIAAQLSLGSKRVFEQLNEWLGSSSRSYLWSAGIISALYIFSGLLIGRFEPYAAVIFSLGIFASFGALKELKKGKSGLTWIDAAIWLLLWIPFDLRWNDQLWFGMDGFMYTWWAFALSVIAILGWGHFRQLPGFGYRLTPHWEDIKIGIFMIVPIFFIAVPIGLMTNFLSFSPPTSFQPLEISAYFLGIFLTIAIPEELFFRAILQNGLERLFKQQWVGWVLASLAFGLMHWNNASSLREKLIYCVLASIAGFFYGWAYKKSGNNILAPVITHTLVDLIWKVVFT